MLLLKPHILSCTFPSFPSNIGARRPVILSKAIPKVPAQRAPVTRLSKNLNPRTYLSFFPSINFIGTRAPFPICKDSGDASDSGPVGEEVRMSGGGGDRVNKWTTSVLLFSFWAGLIFYVFRLAPDQTPSKSVFSRNSNPRRSSLRPLVSLHLFPPPVPSTAATAPPTLAQLQASVFLPLSEQVHAPPSSPTPTYPPYRDVYFIQKLLFLKGDDGFQMNQVLVALWNIMALWPIIYGMLLLPAGRSSKSKVPVWPFLVLSFLGGAYALIPYFVLWKPPPPAIEEDEIRKWPLNFLESRITAWFVLAAGLSLLTIAGLATGEAWSEFYQYFKESKFIHGMSLDFLLLSSFAPFWVYNDMTARKWVDKGSLLLPLSLIPLLGPALYAVLRPRLADLPTKTFSGSADKE